VIEKILHFAFHHEERLGIVVEVKLGDIIFSVLDNLIKGYSFIWLRFVIACWK
jgi:hypothetical protein